MISKCKKNYKLAVAFILGIIVSGLVVYAAVIESSNISYDNSSSGLKSTTLKGAIDELYEKVPKGNKNIVAAYTYNEESCVTGTESTCKKTTCYETKTSGSCPSGTLIEYKVNSNTTVMFNVMYDKGNSMVMQSQTPTVASSTWISKDDYVAAGGNESDYNYPKGNVNKGPLTALNALESATSDWTNVENQTYTMGTTVFATNAYTGCDSNGCTTNKYTLPSRTSKARMITYQEIISLGWNLSTISGPKWLKTSNYWTISTSSTSSSYSVYSMSDYGSGKGVHLNCNYFLVAMPLPIKAVVVISK